MARYNAQTSFEFHGAPLNRATRAGAVVGVNMAAERLRGHSVERAPVDQADLRGSAAVIPATAEPTATLVFDEPYAAAQHEHEEYVHTAGAAGEPAGEAKYVEKNYRDPARRTEYRDLIGKGIADAWDHA